ncbi:hypothetical protein Ancab_036083 [Ancistrocladus abbreviatus]
MLLGTVGLASVGLERPPRELAVDEVNGPTQPVGYLGFVRPHNTFIGHGIPCNERKEKNI